MGPPCSGSLVLGDGASSVVLVGAWAHRLNRTAWLRSGKEMNLALYFMITMLNSDMNRLCLAFYTFHSTLL